MMKPKTCTLMLAFLFGFYCSIAWAVFEWRNPKCNDMAFFRHFIDVVTLQRLPEYQ